MNYVTTNIRLSEDDYRRLKKEAFEKKISFGALVRERLVTPKPRKTEAEVKAFMTKMAEIRKKNAPFFKGVDVVKEIRAMRDGRYGGR